MIIPIRWQYDNQISVIKSFFRIDNYDIFDEICAAGLTHYYITEA